MRFYMIHDGGIDNDADYDNQFIIDRYKKGLQGGLGNLSARITRGKGWSVRRAVEKFSGDDQNIYPLSTPNHRKLAGQFRQHLALFSQTVDKHMERLKPNTAVKEIMNSVYAANAFLQNTSPWDIASQLKAMTEDEASDLDEKRQAELEGQMDFIIYLCAELLRMCGIMLQPVMPERSKRLLDMLGVADDRRSYADARLGVDTTYGEPRVPLGRGQAGSLFPPLMSDS